MKYIENETTELKEIYIDDLRKEIIAFANTKGGKVVIGIKDNGEVVGVENVDDTVLRITNSIRDSIRPDITQFVDIETEIIDGKEIIVVDVVRGTHRPYYISSKGLKPSGVYVRQATSSFPASELVIREMLKNSDGFIYEDIISFNQKLTFNYATNIFEKRNLPFNQNKMKTLGLIQEDNLYTNLALLLSDQCPHFIKAAKFKIDESEIQDRQEFTGSILKQLDDAYKYLQLCNNIKSKFNGLYRIDSIDYPEIALRESLLNAIVHRDYSSSVQTLINIFDDKIVIKNYGPLIEDVELEDILSGVSSLRNPKLANIFYRLELIESYGTGITKIINSYEKHFISPNFETTKHIFIVTLPNTAINVDVVKEYDDGDDNILSFIQDNDLVSRYDLQALGNDSTSTVIRKLRKLKEDGYIESIGNGKNTKYRIKK